MSGNTGDGRRFPFDPGWFSEVEYDALIEAITESNGWELIEGTYLLTRIAVAALARSGQSSQEIRDTINGHIADFVVERRFSDVMRRRLTLITRGLVNSILEGHAS